MICSPGEQVEVRVEREDRAAREEVAAHPVAAVDEVARRLVEQRVHEELGAGLEPLARRVEQRADVARVLDRLDRERRVEQVARARAARQHRLVGAEDGVVLDVHGEVGDAALLALLADEADLLRAVRERDELQLRELGRVRERERAPPAPELEHARAGRRSASPPSPGRSLL